VTAASPGEGAAPVAEDGVVDKLKQIAESLFALEVNTILKANMTASKMSSRAHALLDIVSDYDTTLSALGAGPGMERPLKASVEAFKALRFRANKRSKELQALREQGAWASLSAEGLAGKQADLVMLCRICDNSDHLKEILTKLEARDKEPFECTRDNAMTVKTNLLPEEVVALRKCWELGTEQVVMQTVIHIDGDVISRIHPLYLDPKHHAALEIHASSVATSVRFWARLIKLVGSFTGSIAEIFLGR
jgi:hypothetical protein